MKISELHYQAAELVTATKLGSQQLLQRRLRIGAALAELVLDDLHEFGIVGPSQRSVIRHVLVDSQQAHQLLDDAQKRGR